MKITANQELMIKIPSGKEAYSAIKNINQGDIISAVIIRSEGNRAVLETGGKLITAEFTSGIPDNKAISLILIEKSGEKMIFALAEKESQDRIFSLISRFCPLSENEFKQDTLHNLARFINTSRPDLMDINLFLMGITRGKNRNKKNSQLFMKLMQKGIPHQALVDLGYIIYSRYNPLLYQTYRYLLKLAGKKTHFLHDNNAVSIGENIDSICNIIKDDVEEFSVMFDLFFDDHSSNMSYGRMAVPDGDKFSDAEFIIENDSAFIRLDLSSTGMLEISIRLTENSVLINFLSEKNEVIEFLRENEVILHQMLGDNVRKKSIINYYNSRKVVDKIYLWCLNFYTKSKFSIKV